MSLSLNALTQLGIMILAGMFMGRMMKHIKLPNVTGYLLAGLLLGPYFLPALGCPFSILSEHFISGIGIISEVALGFIAFSIGNEFQISYFKKVGAAPLIIASMESLFAVVVVAAALLLTRHDAVFSLVLGSIAAATAPAATIMVINQYKAKGPVTSTLLSVVAIDDATALILFSAATAVASGMAGRASNPVMQVLVPVGQILAALAVGGGLGILLLLPMRYFHKKSNRLALICGFLFVGIGAADLLGLSSLMLCMGGGKSELGGRKHPFHRREHYAADLHSVLCRFRSGTAGQCPEDGRCDRGDLYHRQKHRQAVRSMAWRAHFPYASHGREVPGPLPAAAGRSCNRSDPDCRTGCPGICACDPRGSPCRNTGL